MNDDIIQFGLYGENQVLQIPRDAKSIQLNMAKIMCRQIPRDAGPIKKCGRTHSQMSVNHTLRFTPFLVSFMVVLHKKSKIK